VRYMLLAKGAIFLKFKSLRLFLLVFHAGVIDALTFCTLKMDDLSHRSCLMLYI
jgi:hypothetical protein